MYKLKEIKNIRKSAKKKASPKKKAVRTKKVGAVKKKKAAPKKVVRKKVVRKKVARKKAAPKKVSLMHKDTKSHNVNIKVMSGLPKLKSEILSDLNKIFQKQKELEYGISVHTNYIKTPGRPKALKDNDRKLLKLYKLLLRENKAHSAQMKKLL